MKSATLSNRGTTPSETTLAPFGKYFRNYLYITAFDHLFSSDQITMNAEHKKQQRLDYLEEGKKVRQRIEDERLKVEGIKKTKLEGLKGLGIADKYQADLTKKRIL